MTGDCHVRIRGSRGLRCPRPPDRERAGSREASVPPSTWTESGQTPALREVSSSRETGEDLWRVPERFPTIAISAQAGTVLTVTTEDLMR